MKGIPFVAGDTVPARTYEPVLFRDTIAVPTLFAMSRDKRSGIASTRRKQARDRAKASRMVWDNMTTRESLAWWLEESFSHISEEFETTAKGKK